MRRALVAIATMIALTLPAAPTRAHFLWHPDPVGDTPTPDLAGDLTGVRLSTFRVDGVKMLRANADLAGARSDYHVVFLFDSRGGDRADYKLRVSWDIASGGIYDEELIRLSDREPVEIQIFESGKALLRLPVWFEMDALHRTKHIRWRVVTWFGQPYDRAPDAGWFAH
jgi:hypothetical protein